MVWMNTAYGSGVAPLYANRESIGPWETFELQPLNNNYYAIKTNNGNYLTAEGDGGAGISTNRTEINAWEMFRIAGGIQTHDGQHFVCAELGSDTHLNATRSGAG